MNTSVTLRTRASDRWKRPGSQEPGANVFGVLDRGAPSDRITSPPQEVRVRVQLALDRLRGALEKNPVLSDPYVLLDRANQLRALRAAPSESPTTRHNAVAQLLRLVGLVGHETINRCPILPGQALPAILTDTPVNLRADPRLNLRNSLTSKPAILVHLRRGRLRCRPPRCHDGLTGARQLVYRVEMRQIVARARRRSPVLVRIDRQVPVTPPDVLNQRGQHRNSAEHVVRVALDRDRLKVRDPVAVRPGTVLLVHNLRHPCRADDVVRRHLSRLVAEMVHDPVECLTRRRAPPVHRNMLNPVRLPVARINTVRVLIRRRLPGLNIGQVSDHQISAARAFLGGRTRGWGLTFSQHHLLRAGADNPICLEAVLLLVRLDLRDGARSDLPIDLRTDDLLHPGVVEPATRGVAVAADVDEVPVLAVTAALIPRPAPRRTLGLEHLLDRTGVDVHCEAGAVVGPAGGGRVRALHLPPDRPVVRAVRAVPLRGPVRAPVAVEEDLLLLLDRAQGVVELEVRVRLGDGERNEVREGLSCLALELLAPVLVGPRGGQIHQPLIVPAQGQECHVSSPPNVQRGASAAPARQTRLEPQP